jgi:hypothetical protein
MAHSLLRQKWALRVQEVPVRYTNVPERNGSATDLNHRTAKKEVSQQVEVEVRAGKVFFFAFVSHFV